MNPFAYFPMPDTHHPFYDRSAAAVRAHLEPDSRAGAQLRVAKLPPLTARFGDTTPQRPEPMAVKFHTFTVKLAHGPAPFVGDPLWTTARYTWRVATDELNRHIAGSAQLEWRQL